MLNARDNCYTKHSTSCLMVYYVRGVVYVSDCKTLGATSSYGSSLTLTPIRNFIRRTLVPMGAKTQLSIKVRLILATSFIIVLVLIWYTILGASNDTILICYTIYLSHRIHASH